MSEIVEKVDVYDVDQLIEDGEGSAEFKARVMADLNMLAASPSGCWGEDSTISYDLDAAHTQKPDVASFYHRC